MNLKHLRYLAVPRWLADNKRELIDFSKYGLYTATANTDIIISDDYGVWLKPPQTLNLDTRSYTTGPESRICRVKGNGWTALLDRDVKLTGTHTNTGFYAPNGNMFGFDVGTTSTYPNIGLFINNNHKFLSIDTRLKLANNGWVSLADCKEEILTHFMSNGWKETFTTSRNSWTLPYFRYGRYDRSTIEHIRAAAFFDEYLTEELILEFEYELDKALSWDELNKTKIFLSSKIDLITNELFSITGKTKQIASKSRGYEDCLLVSNTLEYSVECLNNKELPSNICVQYPYDPMEDCMFFSGIKTSQNVRATKSDPVSSEFNYILNRFDTLKDNPCDLFPSLNYLLCPKIQGIKDADLDKTIETVGYRKGIDILENLVKGGGAWEVYNPNSNRYLYGTKRLFHLDEYSNITYDVEGCESGDAIWSTFPYTMISTPAIYQNHYCVGMIYHISVHYMTSETSSAWGVELQLNAQNWNASGMAHYVRASQGNANINIAGFVNFAGLGPLHSLSSSIPYTGWCIQVFNVDFDENRMPHTKWFIALISRGDGDDENLGGVLENGWYNWTTSATRVLTSPVRICFRIPLVGVGKVKMLAIHDRTLNDEEFEEFCRYLVEYARGCEDVLSEVLIESNRFYY